MLLTFNYSRKDRLKSLELEDQLLKKEDLFLQFMGHDENGVHSVPSPDPGRIHRFPWLKNFITDGTLFSGHFLKTKLLGDHGIDGVFVNYLSDRVSSGINGSAGAGLEFKSLRIGRGMDTRKFTIVVGHDNVIHLNEILYLHGSESLTCMHVVGRNYRIRMSLTDLAATISHPYFIRVKECCIINAEHLYAFNDEEIYLKYRDKTSMIRFAENNRNDMTVLCEFEDPGCIMPVFLQKISPEWHAWFLKVEQVMTKQLKNRMFSINNVANELGICSRQFQRNFINYSGIKPREFAMELRLSLARKQLTEHGSRKLEQIALQSGFKDVQHFKRIFLQHYGVDPSSIN